MNPLKVINFFVGMIVWVTTSLISITAVAVSNHNLRWWESISLAVVFDAGIVGGIFLGVVVVKKLNTYVK